MYNSEKEKTIWCVEAAIEGKFLKIFLNENNPVIGISYKKDSRPHIRFNHGARVGDLVWLVPRGERPGRAGIIMSKAKKNPEHPRLRRSVEWKSQKLYLTKKPRVPNTLVRYSKRPITGSFAKMKIHTAKDEIRKLCGLEPLEELYIDEDLVVNFTQYLEQKFPAKDTTEIEFVKPWLKEMGYRVEMPRAQNPVWDIKVYKRGVGTFLVQVKHSREIKEKNIRELIKEAKVQGNGAWWIALGLIDKNRIEKFEEYSEDLEIWGSREIYETFIEGYDDYSRAFQKIVPLRWALLP